MSQNPIDVALAIDLLVPQAEYGGSVTTNTEQQYNKVRWEDERTQPTWAELEQAWEEYEPPTPPPSIEERLEMLEDLEIERQLGEV